MDHTRRPQSVLFVCFSIQSHCQHHRPGPCHPEEQSREMVKTIRNTLKESRNYFYQIFLIWLAFNVIHLPFKLFYQLLWRYFIQIRFVKIGRLLIFLPLLPGLLNWQPPSWIWIENMFHLTHRMFWIWSELWITRAHIKICISGCCFKWWYTICPWQQWGVASRGGLDPLAWHSPFISVLLYTQSISHVYITCLGIRAFFFSQNFFYCLATRIRTSS